MLGTHDSMTFLKSNWFYELFSSFWRCQNKDLVTQYNNDIRFFDLRVAFKNDSWIFCHGKANLKGTSFSSLDVLCETFSVRFPKACFRIILERGDSKRFLEEITGLEKKYLNLVWYGIKKPWTNIYMSSEVENFKGYNCMLFNWDSEKSFMYNLCHLDLKMTIKKYAKKNIPTKEMIESKTLYLFDYI